eukprot:CAMPEP_0183529624 /NCGR_PEP_ID=MMETSP0371-20130417/23553_1 /TAXON_ID=268820 /ORGANISM="Peridinium aciculiferum, Strain PAER-2" /LENGTH=48 /DNA_ID= /DNA_START= /DNA_END= /DNA_ORIENTATION=
MHLQVLRQNRLHAEGGWAYVAVSARGSTRPLREGWPLPPFFGGMSQDV